MIYQRIDYAALVSRLCVAAQPAPQPEVCDNCGEVAPGCSGLFAGDGEACKFGNKPAGEQG